MQLLDVHQGFSDLTRLRLLHLLLQGPLCVCHFQTILGANQAKISKHLGYLRTRGLVRAKREGNWMVYALPENPGPALRANLACLRDGASDLPLLRQDLARLNRLDLSCAPAATARRKNRSCC